MNSKTILVTGANGQLGNELLMNAAFYPDWKFIFCSHHDLDITDSSAVNNFFSTNKIDAVINAAAYTAVDKAESEKEKAVAINATAVENLANACVQHNTMLVHVSTDYVFDGNNTSPYLPTENTAPMGVYGYSKLLGEEILKKKMLENNLKPIVVRTSWLFSEFGNNFVKTMLRLMKERTELKVVADQIGRPTYAFDLASALLKMTENIFENHQNIFEKKSFCIYHFANKGEISWHQLAAEIAAVSRFKGIVYPITTAEFPTPTRRPAYSVLDTSSFENHFKIDIPTWQNALHRCLKQLKVC
jgi:dTDP-4-dehydrorhamnose reductase